MGKLEKGHLTQEIVKEWLTSSSLFSEEEKENLVVSEPPREGGLWCAHIFRVQTPQQDCILKVWGTHLNSFSVIQSQALKTHAVRGSYFVDIFNADPKNYPFLSADLWAGTYQDREGNRDCVHLMPKVSGISLKAYLEKHQTNVPVIEALMGRLGDVFGHAHARTTRSLTPREWIADFVHGDPHTGNVYIDDRVTPAKISFIDLESACRSTPLQDIQVVNYSYLHLPSRISAINDGPVEHPIQYTVAFLKAYAAPFGEKQDLVKGWVMDWLIKETYEKYQKDLPLKHCYDPVSSPAFPCVRSLAEVEILLMEIATKSGVLEPHKRHAEIKFHILG